MIAATSTTDPLREVPGFRLLRELGGRHTRSFAALRTDGRDKGVHVVRLFVREGARPGDDRGQVVPGSAWATLIDDARAVHATFHPNMERVKSVDAGDDLVVVATELLEGATLADLLAAAAARPAAERERILPVAVLLRIVVDVLGGLHALHGLRSADQVPRGVIHGAVCPRNVVVGRDGVARLVGVVTARTSRGDALAEGLGYAAPEVHDLAAARDARTDVYAAGVLLWEALTGRRLFPESDALLVASRQRSEDLPTSGLPATSPFAALDGVVQRALAFDPSLRLRSASEMGTEIRRIAGTRLAPGSALAQAVNDLVGERVRARRAELDPTATGRRRREREEEEARARSSAPPAERTSSVGPARSTRSIAPPTPVWSFTPPALARPSGSVPPRPRREMVSVPDLASVPPIAASSMAPPTPAGSQKPAPPLPRATSKKPPVPVPAPATLDDADLMPGSVPSVRAMLGADDFLPPSAPRVPTFDPPAAVATPATPEPAALVPDAELDAPHAQRRGRLRRVVGAVVGVLALVGVVAVAARPSKPAQAPARATTTPTEVKPIDAVPAREPPPARALEPEPPPAPPPAHEAPPPEATVRGPVPAPTLTAPSNVAPRVPPAPRPAPSPKPAPAKKPFEPSAI